MKSSFVTGIGLIFGGSVALYIVRYVMPNLITGTSFSENIMTYLVPLGIVVAVLAGVFFTWFKKRSPRQ